MVIFVFFDRFACFVWVLQVFSLVISIILSLYHIALFQFMLIMLVLSWDFFAWALSLDISVYFGFTFFTLFYLNLP